MLWKCVEKYIEIITTLKYVKYNLVFKNYECELTDWKIKLTIELNLTDNAHLFNLIR